MVDMSERCKCGHARYSHSAGHETCGMVDCQCRGFAPVPAAPAPEATREADALCGATTGPLLPGVYDRVHTCTRPSGHFGRHWDGESGWGHVPTREEEQAWCDGMLVQVAALSREIETLRADKARAIELNERLCRNWVATVDMHTHAMRAEVEAALSAGLRLSLPLSEVAGRIRAVLAARAPEPQP